MDEITSFTQPHSDVDPPKAAQWVGAIPENRDRPLTWHYVPVLSRSQSSGEPEHEWETLVADWYEHFPIPDGWDTYVWYVDGTHVPQWRVYWAPDPPSPSDSPVNYSIFLQINDSHKPLGRAIHFGPTPSQVNKVTLGAVIDQ